MARLGQVLLGRWTLRLLGALALGVALWFLGPLVAVAGVVPLGSFPARLAASLAPPLLVGAAWLLARLRAKRQAAAFAEGLAGVGTSGGSGGGDAAALRDSFAEALRTLAHAKGGKRGAAVYALPWYAIIGPPGAGKTTALVNAGLEFPLADRHGARSLRGVGGTRHCDWWFTDEAVLIDTAGRFSTQDSDAAADRAGWDAFLALLRKHRPRQPLNGVLLAVSMADVLGLPTAGRAAQARAMRARLDELERGLGVRLPVYVLLTKADLVAGFQEFFDNLNREERAQPWGVAFPLPPAGGPGTAPPDPLPPAFAEGLGEMVRRLGALLTERLQAETDPGRRSLLFAFPAQVAALEDPLTRYLREVFPASTLVRPPLLRGVYLTSGTQGGTPFDTLLAKFGSPQAPRAGGQAGRSYFLADLLRKLVFQERGLVAMDPRLERRRRLAWAGVLGGSGVAACALLAIWGVSYRGNLALVDQAVAEAGRYGAAVPPQPGPVADDDLRKVLPALSIIADAATPPGEAPLWLTGGLYQGRKLAAAADPAYGRALQNLLLPRLLLRLERSLRSGQGGDPALQHEALKAYLMLGGQGPLEPDLVRQWLAADAKAAGLSEGEQAALGRHVSALLDRGPAGPDLDAALVADIRARLRATPTAQLAYADLKQAPAVRALPAWSPEAAAGANGGRVFTRASGRPLSDGIPGLFTRDGFHAAVEPAIAEAARRAAADAWVLAGAGPPPAADRFGAEILRHYAADFARAWDGLLADIRVVPMADAATATEVLGLLSGPGSPLRSLLEGVAQQTRVDTPPDPAGALADKAAAAAGQAAGAKADQALPGAGTRLAASLAGAPSPLREAQDRYAPLQRLVAAEPGKPAPLDATLAVLDGIYQELAQAQAGGTANLAGSLGRLNAAAGRLPPPVNAWMGAVAQGGAGVMQAGAKGQMDAEWSGKVLPLCRLVVQGRYPFQPAAEAEASPEDLARLFGPQGLVADFFARNVQPFVDTGATPWRPRADNPAAPRLSPAALAFFQRAQAIRDAYFAAGSPTPRASFTLLPVRLDPGAAEVRLELDGQAMRLVPGGIAPAAFTWPGPTPGLAKAEAVPNGATSSHVGPWATFRLLQAAGLEAAGPDRYRVRLRLGAREAELELRPGGVRNPFSTPLRGLACPERL